MTEADCEYFQTYNMRPTKALQVTTQHESRKANTCFNMKRSCGEVSGERGKKAIISISLSLAGPREYLAIILA